MRVLGALLLMAAGACAGTGGRADEPALELSLINLEGRSLELAELRGRPTLLFLFATFDGTSQLALAPLMAATEREDRVTVLGIAVQPDAKAFLRPFRDALDVPFALYIDEKEALIHGHTALGRMPGVPAFVALDSEGHVRRTFFGVADRAELERLIESVL